MPSTLSDIVEHKHREIDALLRMHPPGELEHAARAAPPARPLPEFPTDDPLAIIAEIKRMSPSAGPIRPEGFDPQDLAVRYAQHGASAISCLTDEKFFGGSLADLTAARSACGVPLLRKDFVLHPAQIAQARAAHADAVLLIAECLPDDGLLADLRRAAADLGMSVLLECHDTAQARRLAGLLDSGAISADGLLLGINNRNLSTMTTDLRHGIAMAPILAGRAPLVAESGIRTHADLVRLGEAGFAWALVGEHLMRQPDPGLALAGMLRPGGG
ncbi:MAG: indole-3-glycerol phosphate synthase TrpC [Planctomycetota bacterium]